MLFEASATSWQCDTSVNFSSSRLNYNYQISLTDYCSDGICDANPKYGSTNNNDQAIEYCKAICETRNECEGFFYQKH